jgi:hypothetical protein
MMAPTLGWWLLDDEPLAASLRGVRTIDDLLSPEIASKVAAARSAERLHELLVLARLDPSDDELWRTVLAAEPEEDQREVAAAARFSLILADEAVGLGALSAPVPFVDQLFGAAGWLSTLTAQLLYGHRPGHWSSTHLSDCAEAVRACAAWLPGGFIAGDAAQSFRDELVATSTRLQRSIAPVAEVASARSGVPVEELEASLRASLVDLLRIMESVDRNQTLWVLHD